MNPKCEICGVTRGIHEHHVVPRAYGGINGPTVNLCGMHHTLIHTASLKKTKDRELEYAGHTETQIEKLRELVYIIRRARIMSKHLHRNKPMTLHVELTAEQAHTLRELKGLLGASSIQQTIVRCINLSYTVKNVNQEKHSK